MTINLDGLPRTYRLFVPSGYDGASALPLLVAFHPAGGDGASMARLTALNEKAEADNVIIAYPEGPEGYWDYGVGLPEWEVVFPVNDDLAFFELLLDQLEAQYAIDTTQIYALGYSNGARMAFRVGCEFHDRLAGIAAVAISISEDIVNACPAEAQLRVFYMHGTDDVVAPWEGKPLTHNGQQVTIAWSAPNTVNFWVAQNECNTEPQITEMPDANPEDRVAVSQVLFDECAEDTSVIFYAVIGGGHGWLGGVFNLEPDDYNPTGSATEYVWDFFGFADDD